MMKVAKIWFDNNQIYLEIDTGETGSLSLKAFPRLYNATVEQREKYEFSPFGIHWPELDEDLSFEGFFYGSEVKNEIARVFDSFPEINVNQFSKLMGINQSLMAKYVCGASIPSASRKEQIENALHRLGQELSTVKF